MGAQMRRYVLLAPVPGAVLLIVLYGVDPGSGTGFYPAHAWSTFGVVAGWCALLAALAAVAPSQISRWLATLAALSILAGPTNSGAASTFLFALGLALTALLILVAAATAVVTGGGWRSRVAWSVGLLAVGVGGATSFGYPTNSYLDSPATQVLGALLVSPAFIGLGSIWTRLDQPIAPAAGNPATFGRRFLAGLVSWIVFGVVGSALIAAGSQVTSLMANSDASANADGLVSDVVYLVSVVFLQVLPTAVWGRTLGQWAAGVRVVRVEDGSPPGWLRTIVRFLAFQSIPVVGFVYLAALLVKLRFGAGAGVPDRMVWDHASGTLVVPASKMSVGEPRPPVEPAPVRQPTHDATWESYE